MEILRHRLWALVSELCLASAGCAKRKQFHTCPFALLGEAVKRAVQFVNIVTNMQLVMVFGFHMVGAIRCFE